jgi:hypothetical protein
MTLTGVDYDVIDRYMGTKPYPSRYRAASFQRLIARAGRKFFQCLYTSERLDYQNIPL